MNASSSSIPRRASPHFADINTQLWLVPIGVLLFYIVATASMLFPLPLQFADHVRDYGDPLDDTWVLAWNAHELLNDPANLFNATIFYPYPNSFAFSESEIASGLLALPIFQFTGNAIIAYNLVYFLSFVLCGFGMYLLAYDMTRQRVGALLAGVAFAFWSYRMQHLSHLNLLTLQYMPLAFFALRRAWQSSDWRYAIAFGIFLVLQVLSSWYSAFIIVIGVVLYGAYLLITRRHEFAWRKWVPLGTVSVVAFLMIVAAGLPYFQANRQLEFQRSLGDQESVSAHVRSFISVGENHLYGNFLPIDRTEPLFAGALILVLAVIGAVTRGPTRDRLFWILLIAGAVILALGPTLRLDTLVLPLPYRFLYEFVPGFKAMRAPIRFFILGMLGISILAAGGTRAVLHRTRLSPIAVAVVGVAILMVEYNVAPINFAPIDVGNRTPLVYRWLAQHPGGNVLELPIRMGFVPHFTRAMYFSTVHWHAMPVGYGSFIPPTQDDFLFTLQSALDAPSARLPNLLREFDVRYVVVNKTGVGAAAAPKIEAAFAQIPSFEVVYADETHRLYRVNGEAPPHPLQFSCLFPTFAAPGGSYVPYLLVQQPRHYPIVNTDLQPHTLYVEWRENGTTRESHTSTIQLPFVLRERPEGIPIMVTAPNAPGDYELHCALDNQPLDALAQNTKVQVASQFQVDDATPPLELVNMTIAPVELRAGSEVIATFFWRTRYHVRDDAWIHVQLVDEAEHVWSELTRQPVLWTYPTRLWRDQELVADGYAVPLPKDAPSGMYRVRVTVLGNEKGTDLVPFRSPRGESTLMFESSSIPVRAR